jgi:uncharacterized protein with NRDE domain
MCLLLIALGSHPAFPLIVAANRDEFYDRPTAPAAFWVDAPSVLGGRDLTGGGTWLGIDRTGRFAAVTNYRQGQREPPGMRSRGHLVRDFLTAGVGAREHLERVRSEAHLYPGFNLLVADAGGLFYYSNREDRLRTLEPGVYGLSNHLLDTAWPKVTSIKTAFGTLTNGPASDPALGLFALLADRNRPSNDLLPSTGVGREWERLLSSAFIASGDYGTRSSTVLLVGRDGRVRFAERSFGPGGVPAGQADFEFQLDAGSLSGLMDQRPGGGEGQAPVAR